MGLSGKRDLWAQIVGSSGVGWVSLLVDLVQWYSQGPSLSIFFFLLSLCTQFQLYSITDFLCCCKVVSSSHQGNVFLLSHPDRGKVSLPPVPHQKSCSLHCLDSTEPVMVIRCHVLIDWFRMGLLIILKPIVMPRLMWRLGGWNYSGSHDNQGLICFWD